MISFIPNYIFRSLNLLVNLLPVKIGNRGIKITDLFLIRGSGITTNRDKLTIGFENKEIERRFKIK